MDNFFKLFADLKDLLPLFARQIMAWLIFAVCVASGVLFLVNSLFNKRLRIAVRKLGRVAKRVGKELAKGIEDPVKFPQLNPLFKFVNIVNGYLMALLFASLLATIGIAVIVNGERVPIWPRTIGIVLIFVFIYMAAFFKTQANKDRIALRKDYEGWQRRRMERREKRDQADKESR